MTTALNLSSYSAVQQASFVKLQFTEGGQPIDVRISSHSVPFKINEGNSEPLWNIFSSNLDWSGVLPTGFVKTNQYIFLYGQNGKLAKSVNGGISWANETISGWSTTSTGSILSAASNGTTVVIGSNFGIIGTYDGTTWTRRTSLSATGYGTTSVRAIAYGGSKYVVGGASSKIAFSTDGGVTWTYSTGLQTVWGTSGTVYKLIYANNKFIAIGFSSSGNAATATSSDGITWTNYNGLYNAGWGTSSISALTYNGSKLVLGGSNGKIATSSDGITWVVNTGLSTTSWGVGLVNDLTWDGENFIAVGGASISAPKLYALSSDGINWSVVSDSLTNGRLVSVIWSGTKTIAIDTELTLYSLLQAVGGATYPAVGTLLNISQMTNEIKSSQSDVTITLSGIPTQYMSDILSNPIKGSPVEIRRAFFNASTGEFLNIPGNPVLEFVGVVNNFSIDENWTDPATQTVTTTISLVCSSTMSVLLNKVSGRRTNQSDQDYWFTGDLSMNRVSVISDAVFDFGGTTPSSNTTPVTGKTITIIS